MVIVKREMKNADRILTQPQQSLRTGDVHIVHPFGR